MRQVTLIFVAVLAAGGCVFAEGEAHAPAGKCHAPLIKTLENIEDVRLLFCSDCYRIHEMAALIQYAADFGVKGLDGRESRLWHLESLELFESLKSLDDGGADLMAWADSQRHQADITEDLQHLNDLLGPCALAVQAFHGRLDARLAELHKICQDAAAAQGLKPPAALAAMPWEQPQRELARKMGFAMVWHVWMNMDETSRQAAADRQQLLDANYQLDKAAKLGVRGIMPEFATHENLESCSWRVVEANPGQYDFSRIDRNLEAIRRHGLRLVLPVRSLTTGLPAWAQEQFGDAGRLWLHDANTAKIAPGEGINLMHEPTRAAFLKYVSALCKHLAESNVLAVSLEVKASALPGQLDYSPAGAAFFARFLAGRYQTIEALNAAWAAGYKSFEEVPIPAPAKEAPTLESYGDPNGLPAAAGAMWRDWIGYRKAWVAEYFRVQAEVIHKELPGVPIQAYAIQADSHGAHSERPEASWPLEEMATLADLPSSCSTVEPGHALLRAVGEGRFEGHQAEQNFGSMLGGAAYSALLKGTLYTIARDGPEVIQRYFYSPGLYLYMDRQLDWDATYGFRLKLGEMNRLAPIIENTQTPASPLAVLWSENSFDQDPAMYSRWGALGTAYALMCTKIPYDFVTEELVAKDALARYRVLIVPEQRYLAAETVERIRKFVAAGGTLYATGIPGMYDLSGKFLCAPAGDKAAGKGLAFPLSDVFGADVAAFTTIQAVQETFLDPTQCTGMWENHERGTWRWNTGFRPQEWSLGMRLCASLAPRPGTTVVYRFADGSAAMTDANYGAGRAILLGYPFGHEYVNTNNSELCFGKLYPNWAYPPQMVALERWLGQFVRGTLWPEAPLNVIQSSMERFAGNERNGPNLVYPGHGDTYGAKILYSDNPNHSLTMGLRSREGVKTIFLTVFNRESAYAVSRGYMHYMASPTQAAIRLDMPDVKAVYDVVNRTYVPVVSGDITRVDRKTGVHADANQYFSFQTVIPSYFGRVFAITTGDQAEVFEDNRPSGISNTELESRVATLVHKCQPPQTLVWDRAGLVQWWQERLAAARAGEAASGPAGATAPATAPADPNRDLVISYGDGAYKDAAETLAAALAKAGVKATISPLGVQIQSNDPDPYARHRTGQPLRLLNRIDIYIGNDWDNDNLADWTGQWARTKFSQPALPISLNKQFPGGDRGVLMLSRPISGEFGKPDKKDKKNPKDQYSGIFYEFLPRPSCLIIGASTPRGAQLAVKACLDLVAGAGR